MGTLIIFVEVVDEIDTLEKEVEILDSRKSRSIDSMNVKVCRNFHGDKDKRSWLGFNAG